MAEASLARCNKEEIFMSKLQKSTAVYKHPFCKGYWRDAAAELKDTRMLVFAALIVALRVALKTLVKIPLGQIGRAHV